MIQAFKGVFLSYASEDAQAAERICDVLRGAGIEVWFDQSELRGGDTWDQKIRQQIRDCALFVPIISAHTQARPEGYFRLEWKLAIDRSHLMAAEKAFLVPVVLDATTEPEALVPTQFREVQWTRISAGDVRAEFVERIAALLNQSVTAHVGSPQRVTGRAPARRLIIVSSALTVAALVALVIVPMMRDTSLPQKTIPKLEANTVSVSVAKTPAPVSEKSVAVLPFVDMSEKKDQEYFSDGLSEELIDRLTKVPDLRVPARTSSFYFKGRQTTIKDIAATLGVAHVLEGSVRKSGNTLRITAQLIRADNGYHVWSETFDRRLDDVFRMQDEIAIAVVGALKVSLGGSSVPPSTTTKNAEAYRLYLLGRAINRGATSTAQFDTAVGYLRQATRLDPSFAEAWAWTTFVLANEIAYANVRTDTVIVEMRRASRKALDLAPNLALAHRASGLIHQAVDWDWVAAAADYQKSYDLDPTDANNAMMLSEALFKIQGESDAVLNLLRKAGALDPVNEAVLEDLGWYYITVGMLDAAESIYRKATDLLPAEPGLHAALGEILLLQGKPMDALLEYRRDVEPSNRRQGAALAYFALGRKSEANVALLELTHRDALTSPAAIAQVLAFRGEADQAFDWLERAYRQRDIGVTSVNVDPLLRSLRGDRRWKPFLRKMRLPELPGSGAS